MENAGMFCYQCEQTAKGEGCSKIGMWKTAGSGSTSGSFDICASGVIGSGGGRPQSGHY